MNKLPLAGLTYWRLGNWMANARTCASKQVLDAIALGVARKVRLQMFGEMHVRKWEGWKPQG